MRLHGPRHAGDLAGLGALPRPGVRERAAGLECEHLAGHDGPVPEVQPVATAHGAQAGGVGEPERDELRIRQGPPRRRRVGAGLDDELDGRDAHALGHDRLRAQ